LFSHTELLLMEHHKEIRRGGGGPLSYVPRAYYDNMHLIHGGIGKGGADGELSGRPLPWPPSSPLFNPHPRFAPNCPPLDQNRPPPLQ
jgi:hypothetical protein